MKYLALRIEGIDFEVPTPKGFKLTSLEHLFQFLIGFLLIIGIILSVVFIIISGIQWTASGGSKEGVQKARNRLIYSIIGLLVILLSFTIVLFVGGLFGVELFKIPFITPGETPFLPSR